MGNLGRHAAASTGRHLETARQVTWRRGLLSSPERRWTLVFGLVGLMALATRLGPLLLDGTLRGVLEYDDGVYFSVSQRLVAGQLPYRDFLFLHPPGVVVLLTPFSALSMLVPDSYAFAAARLSFIGIGVLNAVLVAHLLRRFGIPAALSGGGLYAVWSAAAVTERTVLLEPLLNLALLASLILLGRSRVRGGAVFLAGIVLGSGLAMKLWVAPEIVAIAVWLGLCRGRRALGLWLAGSALGVIAWVGPFLLASDDMFDQVVVKQLGRPSAGLDATLRLRYFDGLLGFPHSEAKIPAWSLAIGAVLIAVTFLLVAWRRRDSAVSLWASLGFVQISMLLAAPAFAYHYANFAAATFCLLVGVVTAEVARHLPRRVTLGLAVVAIATLGMLAWSSMRFVVEGRRVDNGWLAAFMDRHRCVWALNPALLALGDASMRQAERGCRQWGDPYGELLLLAGDQVGPGPLFRQAPGVARWQAGLRKQLADSDAVLVYPSFKENGWSSSTKSAFVARFRLEARRGPVSLWVKKRATSDRGTATPTRSPASVSADR